MGSNAKKEILKCPHGQFTLSIEHRRGGPVNDRYILERPGKKENESTLIDDLLLEVYEDTDIWLTNELREQLKQLRQ